MPEPEHDGSSKTAVASLQGFSSGETLRKSPSMTRTKESACTVARRARSILARVGSRSTATTEPPGAASAANCEVLFPGAAQQSIKASPSRGASATGVKQEALSWRIRVPCFTI
eukprot:scaffold314748_cov31-Tisochrysis_lutea.AAC.2